MCCSFLSRKRGPPPQPPQPLFNSYISSMWQNAATSSSLSSETSNSSWPLVTAWGRETAFKRGTAGSVPLPSGRPFPLPSDLHYSTLGVKAFKAMDIR